MLAALTAALTAPIRAAPSQKYTHSGQVPVNRATVSPRSDTQLGEHIGGRARALPHLRERHVGAGDRHHHPIGELLGPAIQHGRNGEPIDAESGGSERLTPNRIITPA